MDIIRKRQLINSNVGKCSCGIEVELRGFTNTCECGRDYNQSGQELGPREQWGEETGESLSEILRIKWLKISLIIYSHPFGWLFFTPKLPFI